jgi:RNA polymerase sigma-70 factor (ECF subfamily)
VEPTSHTDWVREALARFERPLLRYALRITGDVETAQDVVQDTFLKLCQADRAQIEGYLAPWLYRVCRNRALDVRKKEQRMQSVDPVILAEHPSSQPPPGAVAQGRETESLAREAFAELPENQQEVFRLKFQEHLSYKEISAVTGFPVTNVRYLIHISLKRVRERLREQLELAPPTLKETVQ